MFQIDQDKLFTTIRNFLSLKNKDFQRILLFILFFFILASIVTIKFWLGGVRGLEVGKPSPQTVKASRTIEFEDKEKTNELRKKAAAGITGVFDHDVLASTRVEEDIRGFYRVIRETKRDTTLDEEAKLSHVQTLLGKGISLRILRIAFTLSDQELNTLEEKTVEIAKIILNNKITGRNLPQWKKKFSNLSAELPYGRLKNELISKVGSYYLSPNYFFNAEETQRLKEEKANKVPPYMIKKLQGEVIVREGEVISKEKAKILTEMGLLGRKIDFKKVVGLTLLVGFVLFSIGFYLYLYEPMVYKKNNLLVLIGLIISAIVFLAQVLSSLFPSLLIPIAASGMLATILINPQVGIITLISTAILVSLIIETNLSFILVSILGGLFAIYVVSKIEAQRDLIKAGLYLGGGLAFLSFVSSLPFNFSLVSSLSSAGIGLSNALFSIILTIGGLPFLESAFKITTNWRLLELANPNHPLLKELMFRAPGTYNHSIVTGNLVEGAAQLIKANPILARVGAYYHDIGKLKRPSFFVENQIGGENPHDKTNPNLSCLIITSHVKEGVEAAKNHKLPPEIISIIEEHHGNSLISYFYHKAKEKVEKENICAETFRYTGERPKSKESALVMLADSVEAAARTLVKPSPLRLEQMVKKIIQGKLEDGQLDESKLTLEDLEKISQAFIQVLTSIYHTRMEYPPVEMTPFKKRGGDGSNR